MDEVLLPFRTIGLPGLSGFRAIYQQPTFLQGGLEMCILLIACVLFPMTVVYAFLAP